MSAAAFFDYCQSLDNPLVVEFYYRGDKIDDPGLYFDLHPGLFEEAFPSAQETRTMINKYIIYRKTHKLVISEYGFNLVFR